MDSQNEFMQRVFKAEHCPKHGTGQYFKTGADKLEWASGEVAAVAGSLGALCDSAGSVPGQQMANIRAESLVEFLSMMERRLKAVGAVVDALAVEQVKNSAVKKVDVSIPLAEFLSMMECRLKAAD